MRVVALTEMPENDSADLTTLADVDELPKKHILRRHIESALGNNGYSALDDELFQDDSYTYNGEDNPVLAKAQVKTPFTGTIIACVRVFVQ